MIYKNQRKKRLFIKLLSERKLLFKLLKEELLILKKNNVKENKTT